MSLDVIAEARRQMEICNACRYCEGFCDVFPQMHAKRAWADGDISKLANLCHNCRGCFYACQFTDPQEFDLNLPAALAEVRQEDWQCYAWPQPIARVFHRSGVALTISLALLSALLFWISQFLRPDSGTGFYAYMSHGIMVALFGPAFVLPLLTLFVSVRRFWKEIDGGPVTMQRITKAFNAALTMRNLSGGHGKGCNFEDTDRFSNARRYAHQSVVLGFLMCFGATASGTVLHYFFAYPAPYGPLSLPKLLGVPGGILLCLGAVWLIALKLRSDPKLGAKRNWGGEMAFSMLLFWVSASGLALYLLPGTGVLLPLHLGAVLTLFLLTPYSKMAHGFYRFAALMAVQPR